jgi:anti-sigma B factor antagonist
VARRTAPPPLGFGRSLRLAKGLLEVKTRAVQKNLVVDVRGEVDLFSSPKMRSAILEAINLKGVGRVAVNMTGVKYIDSSGVATFVEGLQLAREKKCSFVLFGLQQTARDVFELARLDKIFDIRTDEDAALAG